MYKVQRGVPKPGALEARTRRRRKYPYEEMRVGDMFFVDGSTRHTIATYAYAVGKQLGKKFSARRCWCRRLANGEWELVEPGDKGAVQGVGVWRDA